MEVCSICLNLIKAKKKLECNHSFCYICIKEWLNKSSLCPLCREKAIICNDHGYKTRYKHFNENKQNILNNLKHLMDNYDFLMLEYDEKIERFNKILEIIYENKILLKNERFKKTVIDKLEYLKECNEFIGYYWSQKIY